MKKNKKIISLTAAAALLCVGGAFALNANTSVAAADEVVAKKQTILGASVLLDDVAQDKDMNAIRFPVVVEDTVKAQIAESKIYVLPAAFWTGAQAPTAAEIVAHENTREEVTTDKWVNYYEDDTTKYGDDYDEAVVYMYNIPDTQYANDFYVCSYIKLTDNTEEYSDVMARSMETVAVEAVNSGAVALNAVEKYLTETSYQVQHYTRTLTGAYTLAETTTEESYVGLIGTVTPKTLDGYTYNASLTAQANKNITLENSDTTLACYYENDLYTFTKMDMTAKAGNTTATSTEMTGVDFDDLRGNTLLIKDNNASGMQDFFTFTHDALPSEGYMLLSVYVTANSPKTFGIRGRVGESWTMWSYKIFDENYQVITNTLANVKGKWVTVAVDVSNITTTSSLLCVTEWQNGAELYLGEYTTITTEQYDKNFRDYTVTFNTDGGSEVTAQTLKYGEKVEEPTTEKSGAEFRYWTADGATAYDFTAPVTSDLTLTAVWESLNKTAQYTVQHYFRQINGAYVLDEEYTDGLEAIAGNVITATPKTVEGYTYNATLSAKTATGTVTEDGFLVLAVYYENNSYTFKKMTMNAKAGNTTATSTEMTGVDFDDLRGDTLLIKDNNASGTQDFFTFTHGALPSEGYMLLSVYVTANSPKTFGLRGRVGTGWTMWSYKIFDENYQAITNTLANVQGKWVTVAVDVSNITATSSLFCVTEYTNGAELYLGEYTTITTEQYNQYFAQA